MRIHPAWLLAVPLMLTLAAPARAQWTPVADVQGFNIYAVRSQGDTILAGADSSLFVSTNAGVSFTQSAQPAFGIVAMDAVWMRNGRIYAGTYGQGVFVSDNLGASWTPFNEGLTGGIANSHRFVIDFEVRNDTLYAGTSGAGVYARALAPGNTWHHYGEQFEPNQASNINDLALGGTRLIAAAGANGTAFVRDPNAPDWTRSFFQGDLAPGLQADAVEWTGTRFVVGTAIGVYRSPTGLEPWNLGGLPLPPIQHTAFVVTNPRLIAAFMIVNGGDAAVFASSLDDGATWQPLETLPGVFVYQLATNHGVVYAGRADGLWRRTNPNVSSPPTNARGLRLALEGGQPVRQSARLRFELSEPATVEIVTYDVRGRIVGARVRETMPAGPHSISVSLEGLPPGVYATQLVAGARREAVRLVHVR